MLDGLLKTPEKFERHNKMYATFISTSYFLLSSEFIMTQIICFDSNEDNVWIRCGIYR